MEQQKRKELIQYMAETNRIEFSLTKAAEEFTEFNAEVLKYVNKVPEKRPPITDIVTEFGHAMLRGMCLLQQLLRKDQEDIFDQYIEPAMDAKLEQLAKWRAEGKYKGML